MRILSFQNWIEKWPSRFTIFCVIHSTLFLMWSDLSRLNKHKKISTAGSHIKILVSMPKIVNRSRLTIFLFIFLFFFLMMIVAFVNTLIKFTFSLIHSWWWWWWHLNLIPKSQADTLCKNENNKNKKKIIPKISVFFFNTQILQKTVEKMW